MKKYFYVALMCLAGVAMFTPCNQNNPSDPGQQQVDYDKMIGTWTLNSWSIKQVNTDENIVEVDSTINKGQLTIRNGRSEDGKTL